MRESDLQAEGYPGGKQQLFGKGENPEPSFSPFGKDRRWDAVSSRGSSSPSGRKPRSGACGELRSLLLGITELFWFGQPIGCFRETHRPVRCLVVAAIVEQLRAPSADPANPSASSPS